MRPYLRPRGCPCDLVEMLWAVFEVCVAFQPFPPAWQTLRLGHAGVLGRGKAPLTSPGKTLRNLHLRHTFVDLSDVDFLVEFHVEDLRKNARVPDFGPATETLRRVRILEMPTEAQNQYKGAAVPLEDFTALQNLTHLEQLEIRVNTAKIKVPSLKEARTSWADQQ